MKILIADKLSDQTVGQLESLGMEVEVRPELTADSLPESIGSANVLVVRSTRVTAATLEAGEKLALVIRAGAGVNTIDLATASRRGVYVANCPGKNTAAVAELAIGLLIAADRQIVEATAALRGGAWQKKRFGNARGLKNRTLGIVGFGSIGKAVASRAAGLEMNVVAWSRSLTPEIAQQHDVGYCDTLESLAAECDAVSLHAAVTAETKHLIGKAFFDAMPNGAILINTSRGELVDTAALSAAIQEKGLRVGVDVFENEPSGGEAEFADTELASRLTCTPHIGASTDEAAEAIAAAVVNIIEVFSKTGRPPGAVNLCARSSATHHLVVRHYNRVGVLAGVMDALRTEGVNVEEMENIIFDGAEAACCTLLLDQRPSDAVVDQLAGNSDILDIQLEATA